MPFTDITNQTAAAAEEVLWLPHPDHEMSQPALCPANSPRSKVRQKVHFHTCKIINVFQACHSSQPQPVFEQSWNTPPRLWYSNAVVFCLARAAEDQVGRHADMKRIHHAVPQRPEDFQTPETFCSRGNQHRRIRQIAYDGPAHQPADGSVALGDVWLTNSQERDIVQAGEARRAKAAAAAMCPAVSDSSGSVANRTTARQGLPVGWYTDRNGGQSPESCADSSPQRPEQSFRPEDTPDRGSQGSSGGGTADGLMQYAAACADIEPFLATGGRRLLEQCQARKAYISPSSSTKFTATTRQLLVDWAMLRQQRLKLSDSTMHLAVHLADEMLAVKGPGPFLQNHTNTTEHEALNSCEGWDVFPNSRLPACARR
eukprot:CAMPEP_0117693750 /NCGR_PEP_ID=MMETSP0804-20121206/27054_1 /TAXON_ID=1074897 /ORGANISM="Tetraselmis astigmatica, Strain CCMP880" /LENGTH=371 /DNA_ID=CAMNT_0005507339 /DNA_START=101 /DNA_END=1217 /DNA_ORIENTATION=-